MSLFDQNPENNPAVPLAEKLRPTSLNDFFGQSHLLGEGKWLTEILKKDQLPSILFWGPPGVGKTTLARIIARQTQHEFLTLSATQAGVQELRLCVNKALDHLNLYNKRTLLFIDEIHRWNKSQQDSLLPFIENGTLTLIGATTENPSFELNGALLSRCQVLVLMPLSHEDLVSIAQNALKKINQDGFDESILNFVAELSQGDARYLLNLVENLCLLFNDPKKAELKDVQNKLLKRSLAFDKKGEHHYNVISAFIKSMRGSDPDAALYYLARMLEAGENPLFVARRMVIFASEDIGNANAQAVQVAVSCMQAFDFVGEAEGWIPLAHCATYLACSPKSNASYAAYKKAIEDVKNEGALEVPLHLRNAPTKLMKELGYGKDYKYAHNYEGNIVEQQYLPDKIKDKRYYSPSDNGHEKKIKEWLLKNKD